MHIDNAYKVSNFKFRLRCCKTNLAPPTSCRAFGSETAIVIETIMHNMASKLKVPSVQVSSLSFLPLENLIQLLLFKENQVIKYISGLTDNAI